MMEALWFAIASIMLAGYVVLDGFDFGAGLLHLRVARTDGERRQVLSAIGPFWDGNEVWILAAGGVLFLAFPKVLASGLSGFYLAIFMVLWVLILRGVSIEFRSHLGDGMWREFWDRTFTFASTLAPLLLGVAFGNIVRGVPLDERGWFSLPLFASGSPSGTLGILDWYTVLVGVFAWVAIAHHGALFLQWKTDGSVQERAGAHARLLFPVTIALWIAVTLATAAIAPWVFAGVAARPLAWISVALFAGGLVASGWMRVRRRERAAFVGSAAFLLGLLAATVAGLYPVMLRATTMPEWSLTAINTAADPQALRLGLRWWPFGFVLALIYATILFRLHRGKVSPEAASPDR